MTSSTTNRPQPFIRPRRLLAVAAAAALGVTGAFAVAAAQDDPAAPAYVCPPTERDLLIAANAALVLEHQRPELFTDAGGPSRYSDLRLVAEWARRLSVLDPERAACQSTTTR